MKLKIILLLLLTFFIQDLGIGQVIKIDKIGDRAKRRAEYRKRQKENQAIDKGLDKVEGLFKKKKKTQTREEQLENAKNKSGELKSKQPSIGEESNEESSEEVTNSTTEEAVKEEIVKSYAKYDFVPGDKVIFYDYLTNEESGEFPSKWDIHKGSAENGNLGEDNVIRMTGDPTAIFPYMDGNTNYLPETFTIEFDVHFSVTNANQYYRIKLYDKEHYDGKLVDDVRFYPIKIGYSEVKMNNFGGDLRSFKTTKEIGWRRVSIAYNKGYLKMYVNHEKVLSIPRLKYKPTSFLINGRKHSTKGDMCMIKNFRIAEGGDKIYNRIVTTGKFVTNGIHFDYNSATITPGSMGVINKFVEMMEKYPELQFSIEGHTDSDGSENSNLELSTKRAAAVKAMLISKGIDESRLQSIGKGETSPLNDNKTVEDKANNRRVEFVKI